MPTYHREFRRGLSRVHGETLAREDKLAAELTAIFDQAGRIAARNFRKQANETLVAAAEWTPPHPDEIVDVPALAAKLRTKTNPVRRAAIAEYGRTLRAAAKDAGVQADFYATNPLVERALAGAGAHVTHIADTTRLNVMRSIRQAYEQGLSIPDTAQLIQEGMSAASPARGRLIARTELNSVANGGALAAAQILGDATGEPYLKRWLTAPGARYPRHEDYPDLDGQTVAINDTFDVGGFLLQFPGDPDGPPEEICNCRCALVYVTEDVEEVPRDEQPDVGQDETFADAIDSVIPASVDLASTDSKRLGGSLNEVYHVKTGGKSFIVKPDPNSPVAKQRLIFEQMGAEVDLQEAAAWPGDELAVRTTVPFGKDLERERAAAVTAEAFNRIDPDIQVTTPGFRIGEITRDDGTVDRAGISEFVKATEGRDILGPTFVSGWRDKITDADLRAAALFDEIIGNTDRHGGNFMFDDKGKLILIDHGLAFPNTDVLEEWQNDQLVREAVKRFGRELTGKETEFLEKLATNWPEIDEALKPLLGEEERDAMLDRITYLLSSGERTRQPVAFAPENVNDLLVNLNLVEP